MDVRTVTESATIYDRILRRIQRHLAGRVRFPFEIRLWGDRAYRFGEGEPAVEIRVRDRDGLAALGRLDELGICEAYMAGSLDVVGVMLRDTPEHICAVLGIMRRGAVVLPMDWRWKQPEVARAVERFSPRVILVEDGQKLE